MIRARLTMEDGTQIMVLGLSDANLEALREGKNILFNADQFGIPMNICITWGHTELEIAHAIGMPDQSAENPDLAPRILLPGDYN
jgi:hypothetical protein